jgi:hypothetical protein
MAATYGSCRRVTAEQKLALRATGQPGRHDQRLNLSHGAKSWQMMYSRFLKDLELKAVGLDPETNKMQEGYFSAFRSIGLPIHGEDNANPYSPVGWEH